MQGEGIHLLSSIGYNVGSAGDIIQKGQSHMGRRISFRLTGEDDRRFEEVWQRVRTRTYNEAKMASFLREVMGFRELYLITQDERDYLSRKINSLDPGPFSPDAPATERDRVYLISKHRPKKTK